MQSITDKLAAALLECTDYLAEFMEEGREHRVIRAADAALASYEAVKGPLDSAPDNLRPIMERMAALLRHHRRVMPYEGYGHQCGGLRDATDAVLAEYDGQAARLPTDYRVTWEIDAYNAANPREAAQEARDAMQRAHTTATVFTVYGRDGTITNVDLSEEDNDNV